MPVISAPSYSIPFLEKHQLADELSKALMQVACAAAAQWKGRFFLAFNITPDQLLTDDLPDWIAAVARSTGFPLTCIQLEITESSLVSDEALAPIAP